MAKSIADEYNKLDTEIRCECQFSQERMLTEQCKRFEQLEASHTSYHMHAKTRELTGRNH